MLYDLDSFPSVLTLHLDVFNRCSSVDSTAQTVHVMKYIFPREFGLQNVFTIAPGSRNNVDLFTNHHRREYEIGRVEEGRRQKRCQSSGDQLRAELGGNCFEKLPKRLRGQALDMVQRMRVHHSRCSYGELLKYYCPEVSSLHQITLASKLT
jgi:telomerase reverse transcriptase